MKLLEEEGIEFRTSVCVGRDLGTDELLRDYDAVCVAIGSGVPRDLPVEGRDLKGVYFALQLLQQQNRVNAGEEVAKKDRLHADAYARLTDEMKAQAAEKSITFIQFS